jgi:hypothetical protein
MKTKLAAGLLAAIALAIGSRSLNAQPTNFIAYNFDTDQVSATPYNTSWGNWFGGAFQAVSFDPNNDANHNPASGSMMVNLNWPGQYVLLDGFYINNNTQYAPTYAPLPLNIFTNLSFDIRYDISSAIRTNTTAAGVNGSQGPGSMDFGFMRIGSISPPTPSPFGQDWYYYFAIPATNGLGQPNTNWQHISINLTTTAGALSDLQGSGMGSFLIGMDGGAYGNASLTGPQTLWIDNIQLSGFAAPIPPPVMSIQKASPALRMFGGVGQYGRAQVTMADNNESWIGGPFPISYSMTLLGNAGNFPTPLDTHIQIIQGNNNYSGFDYTSVNTMWLQIISTSSNACTAQIAYKTNGPTTGANPNIVALSITNPVRAGTWTLTFLSDTNGTLTAPGTAPIPFTLGLSDADATTDFSTPVQVRFGIQNNGNPANGGIADDWASISVSGTAGLSGTNRTETFTQEGTNQLDTTFWNLATSDGGAGQTVLVATNAPYWVKWNTPDTGYVLATGTNIVSGPWKLPEFYNSYTDGTNVIPNQTTQSKVRWNLMQPYYLPTADGSQGTNATVGGPLSPKAFFRLQTNPPAM